MYITNKQNSKKMNNAVIYQEMGQQVSATNQIEFQCSYNGGYYVATHLELKGRGIKMNGNGSNRRDGKKTYRVTELALTKLKGQYECSYMATLS